MTGAADSAHGKAAAEAAASVVAKRIGTERPTVGLILGSGLAGITDRFADAVRLSYTDVPGFRPTTVVGHPGVLVAGSLGGRRAVALAGRFHLYEGHSASLAAFPVRVLAALGIDTLFVSNAAGGVRRTFRPGDLMVIADHVNLTGRNPLIGRVEPGDTRFPDMSAPYDPALREALHQAGKRVGVPLVDGIYGWALGPSYETPAEVRMLERFGLDAVGMSTVPEVIAARAADIKVAGLSCITNLACGITTAPVDHNDVLAVTREVADRFESVVTEWVRAL